MQVNLTDAKGYRERQLKEAKDNMQRTKEKSDQSRKNWKKHEQQAETLELEIKDLRKTIEDSREEAVGIETKITEIQQKVKKSKSFHNL